jgi:hypothetical protein
MPIGTEAVDGGSVAHRRPSSLSRLDALLQGGALLNNGCTPVALWVVMLTTTTVMISKLGSSERNGTCILAATMIVGRLYRPRY